MNRTWFEEKTSPKDVFWVTAALGVATVVVKGTKDLYNWSKKRIGKWWDKRNEAKKQEELQKLRP